MGLEELNSSSGRTQGNPALTKATSREKVQKHLLLNTTIKTALAQDLGTWVQRPET